MLGTTTNATSTLDESTIDIPDSNSDQPQSISTQYGNASAKKTWRRHTDSKIVGLKNFGLNKSEYDLRHHAQQQTSISDNELNVTANGETIEEKEIRIRKAAPTNPFYLFVLGNLAAMKVLFLYLITLETLLSCAVTVGLTIYWYYAYPESSDWNGSSLNFILLAFAITSPISAALTMAFTRRERALISVADFRSFSYHLYMAHCLWDWEDDKGGRTGADVDWVEHCDAVLAQLIGIGDELSRFLTLPTTSRSRHRLTKRGRKEAARTIEVAYHLLESMATQRMTRLVMYSERLKKIGLPSGEISRIRQYERWISNMIEQLRMVKMYRTPQAFRSFARIFTLVLPPFYAPNYAQVGRDVNSLGVGIAFGIITALGLTALFESQQILEDPFTAYLALDGIDVREEFEVLHYAQLIHTRTLAFPNAPKFPLGRRAALRSQPISANRNCVVGLPPSQSHHQNFVSSRTGSISTIVQGQDDDNDAGLVCDNTDGDIELGMRMEEEKLNTTCRETIFGDDNIGGMPLTLSSRNISMNPLRSRHHVREWSRG